MTVRRPPPHGCDALRTPRRHRLHLSSAVPTTPRLAARGTPVAYSSRTSRPILSRASDAQLLHHLSAIPLLPSSASSRTTASYGNCLVTRSREGNRKRRKKGNPAGTHRHSVRRAVRRHAAPSQGAIRATLPPCPAARLVPEHLLLAAPPKQSPTPRRYDRRHRSHLHHGLALSCRPIRPASHSVMPAYPPP